MINRKFCFLYVILLLTIILVTDKVFGQSNPSFDCSKASTAIEITICKNSELGYLDRKLAQLYREAKNSQGINAQDLAKDQRQQWGKTRDKTVAPVNFR
jgi:uncharacterized protein